MVLIDVKRGRWAGFLRLLEWSGLAVFHLVKGSLADGDDVVRLMAIKMVMVIV